MEKPPLGLVPRSVRDFHRLNEIKQAVQRYEAAKKDIPLAWANELIDLAERYMG